MAGKSKPKEDTTMKKMVSKETKAEKTTGKLKPLDDEELTGIVGGPGNGNGDSNNDPRSLFLVALRRVPTGTN